MSGDEPPAPISSEHPQPGGTDDGIVLLLTSSHLCKDQGELAKQTLEFAARINSWIYWSFYDYLIHIRNREGEEIVSFKISRTDKLTERLIYYFGVIDR
ncbi:hypothetical protein HNY73_005683 [Argiope bruennichi]|uniref:Uncharacterized protein n=1 Tax=Argiope bruennichi TaxID=94029 RepID=A0A8T0FI69_ARGBR|nr:hypothetical protein HNY73_005683 [Argiope bruennichi]